MRVRLRVRKFVLVMLMIVLFPIGCGISNNSNEPAEIAIGTNDSIEGNRVEITVWDKPHADDPRLKFIHRTFEEFDEKYPNIKVNHVELQRGNEQDQFIAAVAGGEQPDVYAAAFSTIDLYVQQGIAADITRLWNKFPDRNYYQQKSLESAKVNGRIYGVPYTMNTTGLYYNKKMIKDAGLDPNVPPGTWEQFISIAVETTNAAKGIVGFEILGMDWADWHFENYVWAAGGSLTVKQKNGSVLLEFNSEAAVKALQFYQDLKWKYDVTQRNVVQSIDNNLKDFYTGHAAIIVGTSDNLGLFVSKGMKIEDIGFAPLPVDPSGQVAMQVGGTYWIFSPQSSAKQLEAAFIYAAFMTSREVITADYEYQKSLGMIMNAFTVRNDIDITPYISDLPKDITANLAKFASHSRFPYFLKEWLSPYLVKAIQEVLLNSNADVRIELDKAQARAQIEVIDKYNRGIR